MHGVLIVSADPAVRKSLRLLLQEESTVHERSAISEALMLCASQSMDYIFVDDVFSDGTAMDLVRRLNELGYSLQIIPMLLSDDQIYAEPFKQYGVRYCITKPFDAERVTEVVRHIAEVSQNERNVADVQEASSTAPANPIPEVSQFDTGQSETRELTQRLQRLLSRSLRRDELLRAFSECIQDQFDVDNVVLLLPDKTTPNFRVFSGDVVDEVREQFFIPLSDPLVATLMRLSEPAAADDVGKLGGRNNAIAAQRYAERLNVHTFCPVISRGEMLALVGLSQSHRYTNRSAVNTLLRMFMSFFARALENAQRYQRVYNSQQTYRGLVETFPDGAVMISPHGTIGHMNKTAGEILGVNADDFVGLQIEKLDSRLAGIVRTALATETVQGGHTLEFAGGQLDVSTAQTRLPEGNGIALFFRKTEERRITEQESITEPYYTDNDIWRNMSRAIAHNFKNALVPVKTCAELLGERYDDQEFRESFFRLTKDGIDKVNRWVEELMYFSELSATNGQMEVFQLRDAIAKGVEKSQELFPNLNPNIKWDLMEDDQVAANQQSLERVFYELASNAFEAMQENNEPALHIVTRRTGSILQIDIEDNGYGFDDNEKITAFNPFYSNKLSGLGLGLTLTDKVVHAHGGNVEIIPSRDSGSCVELSLPIAFSAHENNGRRGQQRAGTGPDEAEETVT